MQAREEAVCGRILVTRKEQWQELGDAGGRVGGPGCQGISRLGGQGLQTLSFE